MTEQLFQMNISYVPKEDRLLLKVSSKNGDEYRLWLTRRFTGLLVGVINKEVDKIGGMPTLASNEQTKTMIKDGAFEKAYDNNNVSYPLGETGILAYKINTGNNNNGDMIIEICPEQGKGITLSLNRSLLYMFYNLLTQGLDQTGWNLVKGDSDSMKIH